VAVGRNDLRALTKPLLMPLLALAYLAASPSAPPRLRRLVSIDLIASCGGDTLLLSQSDVAFAIGSGCFAVAHVAAILALIGLGSGGGAIARAPWLLVVVVLAWIVPNLAIAPHAGVLAFVVVPYSALLTAMAACAFDTLGRIPRAPALALSFGALAFVESDSTIAFARFAPAFAPPHSDVVVIVFYLIAQSAIVWGFVRAGARVQTR
jgi:uncharacterized membrane protein YhhN